MAQVAIGLVACGVVAASLGAYVAATVITTAVMVVVMAAWCALLRDHEF
jgi:hypothetical protein